MKYRRLLLVAFLMIVYPSSASGETILVPDDQPTIQGGIDSAADGDRVLVVPGTYMETLFFHGKAIAVQSEEGPSATVIDGNQGGSVVTFAGGENEASILDGFTIRNGSGSYIVEEDEHSGGGILCRASAPTIKDCVISENHTGQRDGAVSHRIESKETGTIDSSMPRASGGGGGILCLNASPRILGCVIRENSAGHRGGGISCRTQSEPLIRDCLISTNNAHYGGGIYCKDSFPVIENCVILENDGHGICCRPSSATIRECSIIGNSDHSGGGFYSWDSSQTLEDCFISGNTADMGGGITFDNHVYSTITGSMITDNYAEEGGGIYTWSSPTISKCTISNNSAQKGGGIFSYGDGSPIVENCIVSGNASTYGGGIHCDWNGSGSIVNCTISRNHASSMGGGILCSDSANPIVTNCILWGDTAPSGPEIRVSSSSPEITYSDVQGGWEGAGNIDADPAFAGWWDFHLLPGSPCIDRGTDGGVYTDIDGEARPFGRGYDMGADEYREALWVLELDLAYEEGTLAMDFTLGTPEPAKWWIFLVSTEPEIRVLMLFGLDLAVIDPPRHEVFSHALPGLGPLGVLSYFKTDEGVQAWVFEWVDTGAPSSAGS